MKHFFETLATICLVAFVLALFFLLSGNPSVFDTLRAAALKACT